MVLYQPHGVDEWLRPSTTEKKNLLREFQAQKKRRNKTEYERKEKYMEPCRSTRTIMRDGTAKSQLSTPKLLQHPSWGEIRVKWVFSATTAPHSQSMG